MFAKKKLKISLLLLSLIIPSFTSQADELVLCTNDNTASINDYALSLLRLAVANSDQKHTVRHLSLDGFNKKRLVNEFRYQRIPCSLVVSSSGLVNGLSSNTLIPIPLTRGLLGYRTLVYTDNIKEKWLHTTHPDELKKNFTIGTGRNWLSSSWLTQQGYTIIEGHTVDSLWRMLNHGRFDLFHRGILEVNQEVNQQLALGHSLFIDDKFLISYKVDFFFYVQPGDTNTKKIITEGLKMAYANGSFQQRFEEYIKKSLPEHKNMLNGKNIIQLENQPIPQSVRNIPDKYWYQ
jgi:hypothetical protein